MIIRCTTTMVLLLFLTAAGARAATNNISAGETRVNSLSVSASDTYLYTSGGNEWMTIARGYVSGFAAYGVVFDVFGPDGSQLANGQYYLPGLKLTNSGVYKVVVHSANFSE